MNVVIIMKAFRCDDAVRTAIESVLNQSFKDFAFYIWTSEDTEPLASEYYARDNRIRIIHRNDWDPQFSICTRFNALITQENANYLCTIDADDSWSPLFLEKMISYVEKYNLDIAFCNRAYVKDGNLIDSPDIREMVITRQMLADQLPYIYQSIRTLWGTLLTASTIRTTDFSLVPTNVSDRYYGGDTQVILTALRACNRIGQFNDRLYFYSIDSGSSNHYSSERLNSDAFMYNYNLAFLRDTGLLTHQNAEFIVAILYTALLETVKLITRSQNSNSDKLSDLCYMFSSPEALMALKAWRIAYLQQNEKYSPVDIILRYYFDEPLNKEDKIKMTRLIQYIIPETDFSAWQYVLLPLYNNYSFIKAAFARQIPAINFVKKYENDPNFFCVASNAFVYMLTNNYEEAFDVIVQNLDKCDEAYYERLILLFRDYAAFLEDDDRFLKGWLFLCEYYVNSHQFEKAESEISELRKLGVDNEWLKELENSLMK